MESGPTGDGVFYTDDPVGTNVEFISNETDTDYTEFARVSTMYMRGPGAPRLSGL
jgi:hypothetical protein